MGELTSSIVLDNGSYQMKVGYAEELAPRVLPNAIMKSKNDRKRVFIADQLDELPNRTSLFYDSPFERGYLLNWDKQLQILDRVFGQEVLKVQSFNNTRLLLTDANCVAPLMPDAAAPTTAELCFEIYQLHSLAMTSAPACVAQQHYHSGVGESCLVVDAGHAFTHIVPFHRGRLLHEGVVRVDVGGKLLTNQLKEWLSYRQLNMMDESYVVSQCKEDACFVSLDFNRDMERCLGRRTNGEATDAASLIRDYILPDFETMHRGQLQTASNVHSERQKLRLAVERFAIPELLFHPSDIEIPQAGVAEAVGQALKAVPVDLRHELLRNIILIGGSVRFPNFFERLGGELRSLTDDLWKEIKIHLPVDPVVEPWKAAAHLVRNGKFQAFVTKAEYEEHGAGICRKRFEQSQPAPTNGIPMEV